MRGWARTLLVVLACTAASSCGREAEVQLRTVPEADVARALGPRIAAMLAHPDSVRSFLLGYEQVELSKGRPDAIARWKIKRLGPLLGPADVETFRSLAYSSASYVWDPKMCAPTPGVGLKFYGGSGQLDVAMCFECGMWIFAADTSARFENFDGAAPELTRIVRRLFPDLRLSMAKAIRMKNDADLERRRTGYPRARH